MVSLEGGLIGREREPYPASGGPFVEDWRVVVRERCAETGWGDDPVGSCSRVGPELGIDAHSHETITERPWSKELNTRESARSV